MFRGILHVTRIAGVAMLFYLAALGFAGVGSGLAAADPNGQMYGDPQAAAPYWGTNTGKTAA